MRSWFYQWYQWYTNIVQGSTNGAIGFTIGISGNANVPMVPLGDPEESHSSAVPEACPGAT